MKFITLTNRTKALILCLLSSVVFFGCQKVESNAPKVTPKEKFFNFSTTNTITANINYGFKDYLAVFELFENYPLDSEMVLKTDEQPLYRGATDKNGVFNGEVTLPSYINHVYLYTDFIGAISPVKLDVVNGRISYDQKKLIAAKSANNLGRAFTQSNNQYPDSYLILGDWDTYGRPDYLKSFDGTIDNELLYSIRKIYVEPGGAASMNDIYPEYVSNDVNIEVDIKKETSVSLVLLHSTGSMQNTIGYFTYETGKKPTNASQIQHIIAYPRISTSVCNSGSGNSMYTGDKVELKYWDGQQFQNKFPAGISIGWYLIQAGYGAAGKNEVSIKDKNVFYSIRELNPGGTHRTIAMKKPLSDEIVAIGFEDANGFKDNERDPKYGNFGDAVFYLEFDEDAIDVGGVPDLPEVDIDNTKLFTTFYGMLSFEDLWPSKGDYDMNDVIVEYTRELHKNILTGKVYKMVDTFVPRNNGGSQRNGFGYQLTGFNTSYIKNVTIESDATGSQFMQGQSQEPNQNYPTFMLYDNNIDAIGKSFTVTVEFTPELVTERTLTPFLDHRQSYNAPYLFNMNPFIVLGTDQGRGKEAHLTNFPPTALADVSHFGTKFDVSRPNEGLYYVNSDNLPTALHLANIKTGNVKGKDFIIPKEGASILLSYPKFKDWAESLGSKNSVWWKDPDMSYVINK